MVFSTFLFLFYFLPLTLFLYYASPRSFRMPVLTGMSYLFYGWANPWFILLILWSTVVDFICGNLIYGHWQLLGPVTTDANGQPRASERQRRVFLTLSIFSNLGILGFFKYFMFFQENCNGFLGLMGRTPFAVWEILLPVGISFYTFESISYSVDIYCGRARPASVWVARLATAPPSGGGVSHRTPWEKLKMEARALNAFACYITQFPHLVAGPIIRYQDMEQQLHERTHTGEKFSRGIFFFCLGFAKKVLIANSVSGIADAAFKTGLLPTYEAWFGLLAYAFQIYFDFSGYSDMAIGLGLMFGFEFNKNFDSPYKAQSITEFWRRWHISLSTWLRDYLYIPLGGNQRGTARTYGNLVIVMLLGGFWHGAAWNFMLWGAYHGLWLCAERVLGKKSFYARIPPPLRLVATFLIVSLGWVWFRAKDLSVAMNYFISLFHGHHELQPTASLVSAVLLTPQNVVWILVAGGICFGGQQTWDLSKKISAGKVVLAFSLLIWAVVALSSQDANPFIYFQF